MEDYTQFARIFKALGDSTRLKIIEMLSCGTLCACDILESFQITQPTLSYHMKILTDCGLVNSYKDGSWIHYSNNTELLEKLKIYWGTITTEQDDCICKSLKERENE
ncbi:MAG: metalloregulator ArsR/SmtB family transcription factor [Lachnospiraceae bacterium]|nr:metalloregulator ArsR/SmtB family transcription factor [Lachnospiraceae bacterium]MDD3660006.1 metalloregulator ArsR/SmtB family transcription factor [Lachnospiraceae bacterium]